MNTYTTIEQQRNNYLINTWKECFKEMYRNKKGYSKRLHELKTWDTPFAPRTNDCCLWLKWESKIIALEELIAQ